MIELAIATASTSPSGAHRQPWRFVAISDPGIKQRIRLAAEAEERESYEGGRMPSDWLDALSPLGTDWKKSYLEVVPWIVVFCLTDKRFRPPDDRGDGSAAGRDRPVRSHKN